MKGLLVEFVGNFDALGVGFGSGTHPEVGVGGSTVVVEVGDVEGLHIEYGDVG